jgi:putative protease
MNSKDMCALPYLKDLLDSGICSFKVEGRNKTEYYLATVTKAYRKAISDMMDGEEFDESLIDEVKKSANRGFIPGFLFGFPGKDDIYYEKNSPIQTYKFIGIVKGVNLMGRADCYEIEVRNRLDKGQEIEVMTPDEQFSLKVDEIFDMEGEEVSSVHGGAGNKILKLREGICVGAMLRIKI